MRGAPWFTTKISSKRNKMEAGGKTRKISKIGSRAKVFHGGAVMTTGGLKKEDLIKNRYGRIVSVKKSTTMKQKHASG